MENKSEDEIRTRWEREEAQQRPKKRVRALEYRDVPKTGRAVTGRAEGEVMEIQEEEDTVVGLN